MTDIVMDEEVQICRTARGTGHTVGAQNDGHGRPAQVSLADSRLEAERS
jgi:hypothetical protein